MSDELDGERRREYLVSPRYLAGSSGTGEAGFAPVAHWPHHHFDDGPCQLVVTSPDGRIKIGWFGDDSDLWKIMAGPDPIRPPAWTATFNDNFPSEIVAGLTAALVRDWHPDTERFLAPPSYRWAESVRPLLDAGWTAGVKPTRVQILAPDRLAGAVIDMVSGGSEEETTTLWAGPRTWAGRAQAWFTAQTPDHLIAATAAALADPSGLVRERHMIHRQVEHLVDFEAVQPRRRQPSQPAPLAPRQTAVAAAVHRARRRQHAAAAQSRAAAAPHPPGTMPPTPPASRAAPTVHPRR